MHTHTPTHSTPVIIERETYGASPVMIIISRQRTMSFTALRSPKMAEQPNDTADSTRKEPTNQSPEAPSKGHVPHRQRKTR